MWQCGHPLFVYYKGSAADTNMAATSSPGKRLLRSKSGLKIVPMSEGDRSPFELKEPEWIPDKLHHCRRCGRVCCASCCDTRMELPRMCFLDPVRLCSTCANTTLKEKIFFNQDIKVLMGGAILCLASDTSNMVHCRLSHDHRLLILACNSDPAAMPTCIPLHRLTNLQVERREQGTNGNGLVTSLVVQYCLAGEEDQEITLEAPENAANTAFAFLSALEKAIFMMQESRDIIGTGE
ncbi:zinc finger FYVE domain-containing protein 21-like isoform X2 [Eriocheir sinensis]|uniref:zinc finger FYVE domain-containing protein 21-like isoform X2 n=1 Tax=Eriocheir sinensis TaxID=95602 RepID=UPI0021C908A9|nr:zinc finger FYVE domain-containing protein 21-like isoform X2 [Eriocheir sinensis]